MLKIKLQRTGKRGQPQYRFVVIESRTKLSGTTVDNLGTYNPLAKTSNIQIDSQRYQEWRKKGAQPTKTVRGLVEK